MSCSPAQEESPPVKEESPPAQEELSPKAQLILERSKLEVADHRPPDSVSYLLTVSTEDFLSLTAEEAAAILRASYSTAPHRGCCQNATVYLRTPYISIENVPIGAYISLEDKSVPDFFREHLAMLQCGLTLATERRSDIKAKIRWFQRQANQLVQMYFSDSSPEALSALANEIEEEWFTFLENLAGNRPCYHIVLKPESEAQTWAYLIVMNLQDPHLIREGNLRDNVTRMNAVQY